MPTYRHLYDWSVKCLSNPHEARLIIEDIMAKSFSPDAGGTLGPYGMKYFLYLDRTADREAAESIKEMIARRLKREPLQHILGHCGFRYLDVKTDGRALIPRPETEILVEVALAELRNLRFLQENTVSDRKNQQIGDLGLLDIGTGSGIIGCSVVSECGYVNAVCIDISAEALDLARENVEGLEENARGRISFLRGNLADAVKKKSVDVVCANPPYLAEGEFSGLDEEVKGYDPVLALIGGPTGFEIVSQIIVSAPGLLKSAGSLVLEMAPQQAEASVALAVHSGARYASVIQDLTGRDRILLARW